jgi:ATP/maltotriose-dependent transcriptional regulator MalT
LCGRIGIDDLHFCGDAAAASSLLATLIARSSDALRWIVASRTALHLPIATWLACGESTLPVGEDDLRFERDEARELAIACGARIEPDGLDELHRLTGGWATAMAFALQSARHRNPDRLIGSTASHPRCAGFCSRRRSCPH